VTQKQHRLPNKQLIRLSSRRRDGVPNEAAHGPLCSNRFQAGVKNTMTHVLGTVARIWSRFFQSLTERNDRAVAAWGSSLQYKRRYTNPDDAKQARKPD
jgi:hypothetical protein